MEGELYIFFGSLIDGNSKTGDRVLAPSTNGQHYAAMIDGISGDSVAVTFVGKLS